jgi:glycosyltransferase involved in cell wall biosynthesis
MDTSPPERIDVERWIAREAAGVIATCQDEVGELAVMGAPVERVTVVPCGVDPGQFSPRGAAVPQPTTAIRLLSLGRLVPRKGIEDVLVALAGLPRAELVVAGGPEAAKLSSDPEYRRLAAVADRLGVRDRVRFLGQVGRDQVPPLLRSSDIVVCTPWYEPFGIVPLEAMACGLPVVATAVGGMLDTVVPGVTGRLVPPRRPDLLRDTLARLIAEPRTRQRMGRAGEERVRALYSWERVAARTANVYDRLIEQHAVRKVDRRKTAGRVA